MNFVRNNLLKTAIKTESSFSSVCIMAIYRAHSGDFKVFMDGFDSTIMKIYKIGLMIVVCGDFNINYISENDMRKQLDTMLTLYNLTSRIDFLTRIQNKSSTAINNTFINTLHFSNFLITPLVNGLSDHDAQLLTINETNPVKQTCHTRTIQDINKNSK